MDDLIYWSPSTRGFYDTRVHGQRETHVRDEETGEIVTTLVNAAIPADVVEVSAEQHEALLTAQAGGQAIVTDAHGVLIAGERVVDPEDALAGRRRRRDAALRGSDWSQLADAPLSPEHKKAWRHYRAELRAWPSQAEHFAFPEPPSA